MVGIRRRHVAHVLAVLLCSCVFASGCGNWTRSTAEAPVAGVMDAKGKVALVDLERGRVIDTVTMRSWTGDIVADSASGVFVTAQSGGVGTDADDAIGILDVRTDRSVHYVELPRPNPLSVEVVRDGMVLVDHGWVEQQGMFVCLVDVRARELVRRGYVPNNNEALTAAGGFAWSTGVDVLSDELSLRRIDTRTLDSTQVLGPETLRGGSPLVQCETPFGLAGWIRRRGSDTMLARFDATTGAIEATAAVELEEGAGRLICVGRRLVAADFTGEDLARAEGRLLVFDASTMKREREIRLTGVPSDIAVWRDRVVAVGFRDQTVQIINPATGHVETTVRLPRMSKLPLRVAVLDR